MPCCSAATVKLKVAATAKARQAALSGQKIKPKKVAAKKVPAKKVSPTKFKPCKVCGKGNLDAIKNAGR